MASITSMGVGSGLDVSGMITQLMAVEARPLTLLQNQKTELNTQLSAFGKVQSFTSALKDAAAALTSVSTWNATSATSRAPDSVGVTTTDGAAPGSYMVSVERLATSQTVTSRAFDAKTDVLNAGTLTIELGAWVDEPVPTDFTPKAGANAVNVEIDADDTLADVRDKINRAGAGVSASIVTDASGSRLALRSTNTGAENAFRVSAAESSDDGDDASGLSALAFDATVPSAMSRNQSAINAKAKINGIDIDSASNTLNGVVEGLNLQLVKTTEAEGVEIAVSSDTASIKTKVDAFVKAFNDLAGYMRDQTKYDAASKSGGTLQGDRVVGTLVSQLRGVINEGSTASSTYSRLSDVGIVMKADGTLEVKTDKLNAGLANLPELRKLFATDGVKTADSGFMDRFKDMAAAALDTTNGALENRNSSLKAMITRNDKSQEAMQLRLDQRQKRLEQQYQALDTQMAKLNGLSSYVTQQMALLNNS